MLVALILSSVLPKSVFHALHRKLNFKDLRNFKKTSDFAFLGLLENAVSIGEIVSVPGIERARLWLPGFKLETNLTTDFEPRESGDF